MTADLPVAEPVQPRRFLLVRAASVTYALPIGAVRDMIGTPPVTCVPLLPHYVRGVVNIRGSVLALLDLRLRLAERSSARELDELMAELRARENDHKHWIDELEASILENRPFTLATDPQQCALGRWMGSFEPNNNLVASQVDRLQGPHDAVHGLAKQCTDLVASGQRDLALTVVNDAKHTILAGILEVFAGFYAALRETQREITVVVEADGRSFALAVDEVVSVEDLVVPEQDRLVLGPAMSGLTTGLCMRHDGETVVPLLDPHALIDGIPAMAA